MDKNLLAMSYLRGSANYVWCTTSVLGKGATGSVYQGVDKNNGEPVAVKTFNPVSHMRPMDVQMREFQVLKKVKHENIVKLLAIEEEQDGKGKVIVMELCTGGSLFNILDDPENTYGLAESEFLLVLEHLSAGMKHLRDNNLVHRDLKPGNIMKYIADDGSTIYKLTDFGAARELDENQQFVSLYGTEEYLHPDMYERAVLRKPVGKTFGATVDLWSIGVTLYHIATGNLPFRPFGGRRNKETMYYITTKKASGVISGTQTTENGPIEWSSDLPRNCRLSYGLKKIVTPLLAGLLEVDRQRIWSFDRFFNQVRDILCRRAIHIFNFHTMQSLNIYLHPDEKLLSLRAHIQEQTDVPTHAQIILFGDVLLTNLIEENTPAKGYPVSNTENPFMLFSRENNNVIATVINSCINVSPSSSTVSSPATVSSVTADTVSSTITSALEKNKSVDSTIIFPTFAHLVSVENDASQAKLACSVGHSCKRLIDQLALSSKLSQDAVNTFIALLSSELTRLTAKTERLRELTKAIEKNCISTERYESIGLQVIKKMSSISSTPRILKEFENSQWCSELQLTSKQLFNELAPAIAQLYQRYVKDEILRAEWESTTRLLTCPWKTKASHRAATLVDRLRDGWQHLLRDRATRTLTYNDEQFHVLERIKVTETGRRLKMLLEVECIPAIIQRSESLADWYKMVQTIYLQSQILDKDLDIYERSIDTFSYRIYQKSTERYEALLSFLDRLSTNQTTNHTSSLSGPVCEEATKVWRNICGSQQQITLIVYENNQLIDEINRLSICNDISDNNYNPLQDSEHKLSEEDVSEKKIGDINQQNILS
ncbi:inhibitor of nuclear factor kappa-B kinase subunit epsilon [Chelonus insularis]|uniref:inhibitor of nuclear factor kappa-B kinase subunit epsilon n=1 Tax=Chelonus insularis TaxID=460826 RepID=UPI0015893072|nr:inhibitor of nuclear factor kappa-B kinase subunit epsilon [Chelonus insularis]XP_034938909.1 inhibitor of nuclear factor kappa-B kinase subunit epsilon [Chelonus insularis]